MKLSNRIPHHKDCPIATYQSGICECYVSEVINLEEQLDKCVAFHEGDDSQHAKLLAVVDAAREVVSCPVGKVISLDELEDALTALEDL